MSRTWPGLKFRFWHSSITRMHLAVAALAVQLVLGSPVLDVSKVKREVGSRVVPYGAAMQAPDGVAEGKGLSKRQLGAFDAVLKRFEKEVAGRKLPASACDGDYVRRVGAQGAPGHGVRNGVHQHFRSQVRIKDDGGFEVIAVFWAEWFEKQGNCCPPCPCTCDGNCAPCARCQPSPGCSVITHRRGLEGFWRVDAGGRLLLEKLVDLRSGPPPRGSRSVIPR